MDYGRQWGVAVANAPAEVRTAFIRKTYAHLGLAILAFVGLEYLLFSSGAADSLMSVLSTRNSMLFLLLAIMGMSYMADRFARSPQSVPMQYLGLGLNVVAQAIVFVPILFFAANYSAPNIIPTAGLYTAVVFGGLTGVVFLTGKDFSFLGKALMVAGFGALGLVLASYLFGFTLGTAFSAFMIALAAGYILYDTSNVMRRYPMGAHVAAAAALFSSVMMLFFYILRILMDRRS
jgi:FtsH-binding integral membrane protein